MAVSTIAQYTGGGIPLPAILREGNLTYYAKVHGADGYYDSGVIPVSPLAKDDWVVMDVDDGNTYDATKGNPVAKAITSGTLIIGQIITEPKWNAEPTSSQTDWDTMLAGGYYRVATVAWYGLTGVAKAVMVNGATAAVVPGVAATLEIDASATVALTGGVVSLSCADVSTGGAGIVSFHYVPASSATVSILVGFTAGTVVIQA
jgi:hypothetical protein